MHECDSPAGSGHHNLKGGEKDDTHPEIAEIDD
jgi:hypothetical protein